MDKIIDERFANFENSTGRKLSFLEAHYIRTMEEGEDHAMYVVVNDINDDEKLCNQLRKTYQEYKDVKGKLKCK